MKAIAIIPARYSSTRFPGKPLVMIDDKPMIQHVYERSRQVFDTVVVATDNQQIADTVHGFGGKAILTSPTHLSGTDRCAEATEIIRKDVSFDIVINVQGDEPFVKSEHLNKLLQCFEDDETQIATLATPVHSSDILFDPNKVKLVREVNGYALYFSRQAIPFQRDKKESEWLDNHPYLLHMGLYAYRVKTLSQITKLDQTPLEKSEKLEQLRWLENGYKIKVAITNHPNIGIDTPEDLESLLKTYNKL
ncbi:MAG: 3-deoxy-manno-octulosonate cytidylyltransferase [Prolixibacteraceae bacterium]|nr:3-deoxy-manno-octulosonate cytidylyltransferase [Prolixibacteraceae bacterium]